MQWTTMMMGSAGACSAQLLACVDRGEWMREKAHRRVVCAIGLPELCFIVAPRLARVHLGVCHDHQIKGMEGDRTLVQELYDCGCGS